jgi:serine phosphatase RsbU (regulator of sigma subunit)
LQEGDVLYLYTDGYADQFGGPKGKKFKYKQLNDLLLANSKKSMNDQSNLLVNEFDKWKGNLEQVDDVCVIGIRI